MKGFAWWKGTGRPWERGRFWRVKKDMAREIFVIAGLGNPGAEYAHTRHNAGFDTMDLLAERLGVQIGRKMLGGLLGETLAGEKKIVLCKPQTFMNASGECVEKLLQWYHVEPDHLLVIYDDIDLAPGTVRMRRQGGPGTHNGMRDIVARLNRQDFARLRIGTGDRPAGQDLVGWVLERRYVGFSTEVPLPQKLARAVIGLMGYYALSLIFGALLKQWMPGAAASALSCFLQIFYIVFLFPACAKRFEQKSEKA